MNHGHTNFATRFGASRRRPIWPIACSRASTRTPAAPSRQAGPASSGVRRWLAAAAVLAVAAGAGPLLRAASQAAEAARVQEELRLALQITSDTLARVQSKLSQPADNEAGKGNP